MKPFFVKTPKIIQKVFSDFIWRISKSKDPQKVIYLTFDDGPIPEITYWILKTLDTYNAKATFFCVGDNIRKYPDIFNQIIAKKHQIGNHTFNHLNGWKTTKKTYLENIEETEKIIQNTNTNTQNVKLFRPPYGKIRFSPSKYLIKKGYQIIMWDVLSGDFYKKLSKEKCLQNVINHTQNGSIVVFHDSEKAFKNLNYTLPRMLEYFSKKGYLFRSLDCF